MFADLSCFGDDAGAIGADGSDEDVDGADELVLPLGEASQAGPRRISLSSLWSGSSGISLPQEDDPSMCHRASSSASSPQRERQSRSRLQSACRTPAAGAASPPFHSTLESFFPAAREQILT